MYKRSKADHICHRGHNTDEKAIGNSITHTGSTLSPLAELDDEKTMIWQNNNKSQGDEPQSSD